MEVGGGDGLAVVELGGERATVLVGSSGLKFDGSSLAFDDRDVG